MSGHHNSNISDRQVLIMRPLAQKLMDLTLGRYQILEHHRHRIPEFLAMCALDVESFLIQFSKLDLERALKDARAAQMMGTTSGQNSATAALGGGSDGTGAATEVTSSSPPPADDDEQDDDLDAWCKRLPPAELIPALKQRCERTKASELFLRSTVSDLIGDLEKKEVALDTLGGQIRRRDERLAGQREAFLRENRQIREILRQFRERGKCDLPDPVLYEWDDGNDGSGNISGATPRKGGRAASGGHHGASAAALAGDDPSASMRAAFDAEKEQIEKGFTKQLEESKFRVRSLEAQLANLARVRSELQQQVATLQQRIGELEAERSRSPRENRAPLAADDAPRTEQLSDSGPRVPSAGKLDGALGSLSPPHQSTVSLPSPRADASAVGGGGAGPPLNPKQSGLSVESRIPSTSSPRSSSNRSPRGSNASLKAGIAAMSLSTIAVVRATDTVATQTDRDVTVTPPLGSATFALDVDQQLQEVLSARQPTPDGLGAGVMRSISTNSQATRQREAAPGKAIHSSSSASTTPRTGAGSNSRGAATAVGSKSSSQLPSSKRGAHATNNPSSVVATSHSPVRVLLSPDGTVAGAGSGGNSGLTTPRSPGSTLHAHDGVVPLEGTSPWGDDQPPAAAVTSALEISASTPSQLEKVKRSEEIAAKGGGMAGLRIPAEGASAKYSYQRTSERSEAQLLRELDKLRQENLELRHSMSGPVVASTAPQNSAALLKKLKDELYSKSALLDEKSAELEQLKLETMRWFAAYKRAVPPPNLLPVGGKKDAALSRAPNGDDLLVNFETVAMLKATVAAADEAEETYRVLTWKLVRDGVRYAMALIAQEADCVEARRQRDAATLIQMQRGMDLVDHRAKTHLGRVRRQRVAARVQANRLWDRVLVLAKGVCSLDPIPDALLATPRAYHQSTRAGGQGSSPKPQVEVVPYQEQHLQQQPTAQHSAYFRAASAAAAEFTMQRLHAPPIPTRGITAVSPQTFLPQRPQSASVSRPANAGDPDESPARLHETGGGDGKPTFSQKLRGAVVRPTSAAMMTRLHPKQQIGARPGSASSASVGKTTAGKDRESGAQTTTAEHVEAPPPTAFSPSTLRHLSAHDRRSYVVAALTRDKLAAAHEKRQLAEERYAHRASACATIPPDMKRDDASALMQTVKLVGRNESTF